MAYVAYITNLKNVRKHPNADRLQLGDCFGNTVVVSMEYTDNQLGIYFPTDGQLSVEYAEQNNLVRKKDDAGNNIGGYMDPDKRNVTSIKLRGEKSDGLFMPLKSLAFTGVDLSEFKAGDTISTVNGHEICQKYIPKRSVRKGSVTEGNRTRKKKVNVAPLFAEHADTEQLAYNMDAFKNGDIVEISIKLHGTSNRIGYLPVLKGYKRSILDKILRREGTPIYDWDYISGTRRTVLKDFEGGFYGSDLFRKKYEDLIRGRLYKGETLYGEIVGYTDTGVPIMGTVDNKKVGDKEFIKQYGKTTTFAYGCDVGESEFYAYRMTMTNEDGDVVEYTPDYMRYRCEQMGIKYVPVAETFIIPEDVNAGEYVKDKAEEYYDGSDPIGKTHVREGVVCRIINRPSFTAYKHKNFFFKCLAGIAVAQVEDRADEISADLLSEM